MYVGQTILKASCILLITTFSVGCLSRKKDKTAATPAEAPPAAAYPDGAAAAYADSTMAPPPPTEPAPYQRAAAAERKPEPFTLRADEELVTHEIKSGENLSVIASKYDSSIRRIQAANGMTNTKIYAGKTLQVPVRKTSGIATRGSAPSPPSVAPAPPTNSLSGGRFGAAPAAPSAPVYHGPAGGDYVSNSGRSGTIAPPPVEKAPDPASTSYPRVTTPVVPPTPEEAFPTPNLGGN